MNDESHAGMLAAASAALTLKEVITPEDIHQLVQALAPAFGGTEVDIEDVSRELEMRFTVEMGAGALLAAGDWSPWVDERRGEIDWFYWKRYRDFLAKGKTAGTLQQLDNETDRILDYCGQPSDPNGFNRRGLVVGHVQSGKTRNYLGLITKAADAGYKAIIIIAGIPKSLREQTQERVDEGFIGFASKNGVQKGSQHTPVGVGIGNPLPRRPQPFTNRTDDFLVSNAESIGVQIGKLQEPAVFVVKKNAKVLENLIQYLQKNDVDQATGKMQVPMLIVDDEADNASINIKYSKDEIAKINSQIRTLLNLSEKSTYVGYTATPFANIFIDPLADDDMVGQDLFPRDFIYGMQVPGNYIGPQKVFLDSRSTIIKEIGSDAEDLLPLKHKIDHVVRDLPESLRSAARAFVLNIAVRRNRGHVSAHNSMLVNVSRFNAVQVQVAALLLEQLTDLRDAIQAKRGLGPSEALQDPLIRSLHDTWEELFVTQAETWSDIFAHLHEAISPISVVTVNMKSKDRLDYELYKKGRHVIAVGGLSLSRGLTLEGLSTSYFLRNSKFYDTLLQMGRYFGYRPGYEDLCRVWMTDDSEDWYRFIAEVVEELHQDIFNMEKVGGTPKDFGLRVRSHPASLQITGPGRLALGEERVITVGLSGSFIETWALGATEEVLASNVEAVKAFLAELGNLPRRMDENHPGYLLTKVPAEKILGFIGKFKNEDLSIHTDPDLVGSFIEEKINHDGSYGLWDVLVTSQKNPGHLDDETFGIPIKRRVRRADFSDTTISMPNFRLFEARDERAGLTDEEIQEAVNEAPKSTSVAGKYFRKQRSRPLLCIMPVEFRDKKDEDKIREAIAWGISFPGVPNPQEGKQYVVNQTALRQMTATADEYETDEEMDDDE